jgi:hypothetical protein
VSEQAQERTGVIKTVATIKATSARTRLKSWQHEKSFKTRTFALEGLAACSDAADKSSPKIENKPRPEVNRWTTDKTRDALEKNLKSASALERGRVGVVESGIFKRRE